MSCVSHVMYGLVCVVNFALALLRTHIYIYIYIYIYISRNLKVDVAIKFAMAVSLFDLYCFSELTIVLNLLSCLDCREICDGSFSDS